MKDNTERAIILISQALKLCNDFALSSAKSHLCIALQEINKVTKKRDRREITRMQIEKQLKERKEKEEAYRKKLNEIDKDQMDTNFQDGQTKI
jgi:hypothetical protein